MLFSAEISLAGYADLHVQLIVSLYTHDQCVGQF